MSEMMPEIGGRAPITHDVEAGKSYWWCACGKSKKQPFCDGSHKGTGLAPHKLSAPETKDYYLCGCKATRNNPFCDGTHKAL